MSGVASIVTTLVLRVMTALPGFQRELRLLPTIVRRGDVVLDIGASLGVYSVTLAALVGRTDIVVPGRRWAEPGRSHLSLGALHRDHDDGLVERSRDRVDVQTIDELRRRVGKRVAMIKCDVEGFELAVLRGAATVLRTDRPVILCEIEQRHAERYGHQPDDVEAFLRRHHYDSAELNGSGSHGGRNQLWVPQSPDHR
jgi:hypothetical protein